jgi:hypothetical protein
MKSEELSILKEKIKRLESVKAGRKLPEKLVQILSVSLGSVLFFLDYLGYLKKEVEPVVYLLFAGVFISGYSIQSIVVNLIKQRFKK